MSDSPAPTTTVLLDPSTTEQPPAGAAEGCAGRSPDDLRRIAVAVAVEAAGHVVGKRRASGGRRGRIDVAATKSSAVDPVTDIDTSSEALIRTRLGELAPEDGILGEEDGGRIDPDAVTWVVDPVDGTVNLIYGIPASAVSVAACIAGVPVAGAVVDLGRALVYSASSGGPAYVGDISDGSDGTVVEELPDVSRAGAGELPQALVGTGFSYMASRRRSQVELLTGLITDIRDIRRMGSAALDLCAVAAGHLDAYYEHGLGTWDHAAGCLIAARAGAVVHMPVLDAVAADGTGVLAAVPAVAAPLAERVLTVTFPVAAE